MKTTRSQLSFSTVRTEGSLLPVDLLQRIVLEDKTLPGLSDDAYYLPPGERLRDAMNRAWSQLTTVWKNFKLALDKLPESERANVLTRDKWLLQLFSLLGYGRLVKASEEQIDGKSYAISHGYNHSPIHFLGCRTKLDDPQRDKSGRTITAHGLVQDYLNRSEKHLWGFVSNGYTLRILRDHHSLTQLAYVEFDLQAMMEGEHFSEFCLLWLVCHQSRVYAEKPEECWLEKWFQQAQEDGVRALDKLRHGVEKAICALGTGFLKHKANKNLLHDLQQGILRKQDYYRLLLRLVYRLIFLFVAEDRDLLHDKEETTPEARDRYTRWYATGRLRALADKRRGGPHGDAWQGLLLVMRKLATGSSELGLPALGSFLWRRQGIGLLDGCELANEHLYAALKELCYTEQGKTRFPVSWRNIGAEELGSVYESLLERHPNVLLESATFELDTAAGHERKTTGSYYTPKSLVECLLDSALDPVLDEAAKQGEAAILQLKVCDPACGSGHFLVAAARRIATRLAMVRCGGDEPSPQDVRHALRDVVGRCIYGVDLNKMAVELCKVSLWMEALEPGKPLSFLEAHIRDGNALLGATPKLMDGGIPNEAFEVLEGDDKNVTKRLKKRNKDEREGQTTLFSEFAKAAPMSYGRLSSGAQAVEADGDEDIGAVEKKEADWDRFTESKEYTDAWLLADAWCAAFVWPKEAKYEDGAITHDLFQRMKSDLAAMPKPTRSKVRELSRAYSFFHWHLAFPQVFLAGQGVPDKNKETGWAGGFDVVLGNPPWDALSPDAKEFFSQYDPGVRFLDPTAQEARIAALTSDSTVGSHWESHRKYLYSEVHFLKESGRYKLYAPGNLGKGDFNIYRMFVETALITVRVGGMVAQIVPEGLYNGANAMAIRQELMNRFDWKLLLGLQNLERRWFPAIYYRMRFCLYAALRGGQTTELRASFGILSDQELTRAVRNPLVLPCSMIVEFSPDALAIMELQSQREINITAKMYSRWPKFGDVTTPGPHRQYMAEIHMGNDRGLFKDDRDGVPLYEGRMVYLYDHRAKGYRSGRGKASEWANLSFTDSSKSIQPQWYVQQNSIPEKARDRIKRYRIGFCDVASPTNERSLVAALLPPHCVAGDKVPTITFEDNQWQYTVWLAAANSFVMDFLARKKVSLKMSYTVLDSLPFPRLSVDAATVSSLAPLVLALSCTGPEMTGYWNEMAQYGWVTPVPENETPPGLIDEEQRLFAVCEIEAIVAHDLYGLTRDELAYIMDTFPIVEKRDKQKFGTYRTKELVLEAFDRRKSS